MDQAPLADTHGDIYVHSLHAPLPLQLSCPPPPLQCPPYLQVACLPFSPHRSRIGTADGSIPSTVIPKNKRKITYNPPFTAALPCEGSEEDEAGSGGAPPWTGGDPARGVERPGGGLPPGGPGDAVLGREEEGARMRRERGESGASSGLAAAHPRHLHSQRLPLRHPPAGLASVSTSTPNPAWGRGHRAWRMRWNWYSRVLQGRWCVHPSYKVPGNGTSSRSPAVSEDGCLCGAKTAEHV
ncbi:hypothetical protein NDU88_003262 [Pleurodeles waltl]|uniref:Uncharacterized protein n=1 Tax=Pleurodeles waltl TaxID=8319 RepID=A0AAV7SER9_PLEWA|nr:hypothetical protein NDU88_003262 [Pleurodeles waltl]